MVVGAIAELTLLGRALYEGASDGGERGGPVRVYWYNLDMSVATKLGIIDVNGQGYSTEADAGTSPAPTPPVMKGWYPVKVT